MEPVPRAPSVTPRVALTHAAIDSRVPVRRRSLSMLTPPVAAKWMSYAARHPTALVDGSYAESIVEHLASREPA